jgi:hypothetical protein
MSVFQCLPLLLLGKLLWFFSVPAPLHYQDNSHKGSKQRIYGSLVHKSGRYALVRHCPCTCHCLTRFIEHFVSKLGFK